MLEEATGVSNRNAAAGEPGDSKRDFDAIAPHEFEAALAFVESISGDRDSWIVESRYIKDRLGLICGERIKLSPSEDAARPVIELDTHRNLILLPDGGVRKTTVSEAWELSEKLMDFLC